MLGWPAREEAAGMRLGGVDCSQESDRAEMAVKPRSPEPPALQR